MLIKVARIVSIVSTQKANRAARFIAARFIARHIEVETPRLEATRNHSSCKNDSSKFCGKK